MAGIVKQTNLTLPQLLAERGNGRVHLLEGSITHQRDAEPELL
jgi:hypothetical protein